MNLHLSPTCPPPAPDLSPSTLWMLCRTILHVSPTCLPLDFLCLAGSFKFVSHLSPRCPRGFKLISHLSQSPTTVWILCPRDFRLVSTCLHFSPNTLSMPWVLWPAWFSQELSPIALEIFCAHDFKLVSTHLHLPPPCVPVHLGCSECFGPLISHLFPSCLPLHSAFSARMISGLSPACLPLHSGYCARMIPGLSPTCLQIHSRCSECFGPHDFVGFFARMISHFSPSTCLPVHSPSLSERSGLHNFSLVSQLSPSTFAGSDLKYHEIRLIYKQTVWGQRWYNCIYSNFLYV